MAHIICRSTRPDRRFLECLFDSLGQLPELDAIVREKLPRDDASILRVGRDKAYEALSSFFVQEAAEMGEDEPFTAHYLVAFDNPRAAVLVCDVELSTAGVEARTFYGASVLRLGPDDFIVDLEGSIRLVSAVERALQA
jgi:hypothetical protein